MSRQSGKYRSVGVFGTSLYTDPFPCPPRAIEGSINAYMLAVVGNIGEIPELKSDWRGVIADRESLGRGGSCPGSENAYSIISLRIAGVDSQVKQYIEIRHERAAVHFAYGSAVPDCAIGRIDSKSVADIDPPISIVDVTKDYLNITRNQDGVSVENCSLRDQ